MSSLLPSLDDVPETRDRDLRRRLIRLRLDHGSLVDRTELKNRCTNRLTYADEEQVQLGDISDNPPTQDDHWFGENIAEEQHVYELRNAAITDDGLVFTADGNLVLDSARSEIFRVTDYALENVCGIQNWSEFFLEPARALRDSPRRTYELAFSLVPYDDWTRFYYHWVVEKLPQIRGLEAYTQYTGHRPTVLLPPDPPNYVRESLSLLGIDEDNRTVLTNGTSRVRTLVLPTLRPWTNIDCSPARSDLRWLQSRLTSAAECNVDADGLPSRIYISRDDAERRQVVNEDEVLSALEPLGFEKYVLSELHVRDQIRLFANADYVVGPHGSGLTNVIFADNLHFLEFHQKDGPFSKTGPTGHYYCLATLLNLDYHYMVCETRNGHVVVEVDELLESVEKMID